MLSNDDERTAAARARREQPQEQERILGRHLLDLLDRAVERRRSRSARPAIPARRMRTLVRWSASSLRITTPRPCRAEPSRRMALSFVASGSSGCRSPRGSAPRPRAAAAVRRPRPPRPPLPAARRGRRAAAGGSVPPPRPAARPGSPRAARRAPALRASTSTRKPPPSTWRPSSGTVPMSAMLPSLNSATRSQTLCTRSSRCDDSSTLTPRCLRSRMISSSSTRGLRIEAGGRLVEDRDLRVLHQDLGEPEPLAHAAREGRDALVDDVGEPDMRERSRDLLLALRALESRSAARCSADCRRR